MSLQIKELDRKEYLLPGHTACPGCPAAMGLRLLGKALGGNMILVIPASCATIIQGAFPKTSLTVPLINVPFASSAAIASGISETLDLQHKDVPVVVFAGDGGTGDIGLQALSGAAERGENIIYICYDNEGYENTGIQRSCSTPYGAWTTTTIKGKPEKRKDIPSIIAAHGVPYVATASVSYPLDFIDKVRKSSKIRGLKYIHLHAPCPTGWRFPSEKTIEVGRLAVLTGTWILYEIEYGSFRLTGPSRSLLDRGKRKQVEEYLKAQGRFKHLNNEMIKRIKEEVESKWEEVKGLTLRGERGSHL